MESLEARNAARAQDARDLSSATPSHVPQRSPPKEMELNPPRERHLVYSNDRWYRSRRVRGNFAYIEERRVPSELTRVPQGRWRNYPSGWKDQNGDSRYGRDGRRHYLGRSTQPSNRGTKQ